MNFKFCIITVQQEGLNRHSNRPPSPPDDENKSFLRKGSLDERKEKARLDLSPRGSPRREAPTKPPVPKETAYIAPPKQVDYVAANRVVSPRRAAQEATAEPAAKHREFGAVPLYLRERKQRQHEEEARRIAAAPDPNCPPGMTLLSESERLETLDILRRCLYIHPFSSTTIFGSVRALSLF